MIPNDCVMESESRQRRGQVLKLLAAPLSEQTSTTEDDGTPDFDDFVTLGDWGECVFVLKQKMCSMPKQTAEVETRIFSCVLKSVSQFSKSHHRVVCWRKIRE